MSVLNLFPSRIRFVNSDGTLAPEALRMLDVLVARVGGAIGDYGDDVIAAASAGIDPVAFTPDVVGVPSDARDLLHIALQPVDTPSFPETTFQGSSSDFLSDLVVQPASAAAPISAVVVGASPTSFTAIDPGTLSVQAGTVSTVTLTRGGTTITLGLTAGLVPMSAGDKVTITYTVAPTLNFIPR